MSAHSRSIIRRAAALVVACNSATLRAQTPAPPVAPVMRLDQIEDTYHANLRRYHAPVIQEYLRELERLKAVLAAKDRDSDAARVQKEIETVKKLSTSTGLLPYGPLKPPPPEQTGPPAPPPGKPAKPDRLAIVFPSRSASQSAPDPASINPRPNDPALPLGLAEWRVDKLGAGDYAVSVVYSCAENPSGTTVQATLGSSTIRRALTNANTTGGLNDFRIARLGIITLDQDVTTEKLQLQCLGSAKPAIWVKQVMLSKAKE